MSENFYTQLSKLPENLAAHLQLTVIALGVGVLISVPLAVLLTRARWLRYPALTTAGVIQTIPSIALLALMVPILAYSDGLGLGLSSFGLAPALIALTMYSFLPILRNTVTGIEGVDPAMVEAARGMGMYERQVLMKVQLPLAAPVIIAGIRTATVWIVGIATLATPVGQRCLGNYIFGGLQTRNWVMVLFGVVAAAALAVLLDLLIGGLQKATDERRRGLGTICGVLVLLVIVGGIASPTVVAALFDTDQTARGGELVDDSERTQIAVAGAATPSQRMMRSMLFDGLYEAGYRPVAAEQIEADQRFAALTDGRLQVMFDFDGQAWDRFPDELETEPQWQTMARLNAWLAEEYGVRCIGPFGHTPPERGVPYDMSVLVGPEVADYARLGSVMQRMQRRLVTTAHPRRAEADDPETRPTVTIGAKTFTEQFILAELLRRRLADAGFNTEIKQGLGSTMGFSALTSSEVDVYVDYSGTIWANYMQREDIHAAWYVRTLATRWLADEHDVRHLGPLGFENTYVLVMPRQRAEELGIETIDDLAKHAPDMKIGGDYEFFNRPEWQKLRETYGLNFQSTDSFDSSLMYDAVAQGEVDVISAFSTNGQIAAFDLKVIEDPRNAIPPYEAMVLMSPEVANRADLARALLPLLRSIDADLMRRANHMVDRDEDKRTVEQAAAWLEEQILERR